MPAPLYGPLELGLFLATKEPLFVAPPSLSVILVNLRVEISPGAQTTEEIKASGSDALVKAGISEISLGGAFHSTDPSQLSMLLGPGRFMNVSE